MRLVKKTEKASYADLHRGKVNRLSSRQYSMALYLDGFGSRVINYDVLSVLNQGTVGSFLIRGYLEVRTVAGESVAYWTKEGSDAVKRFADERFDRQFSTRFSSQFSLEMYDRSRERQNQIREVKRA